MSTLLTYRINTSPNPITEGATSASITLLATNHSDSPVSIEGIFMTIPVGTDADDLTNLPNQIVAAPPDGWPAATSNSSAGIFKIIFAAPSSTVTPEEAFKKITILYYFISVFRWIFTVLFFWRTTKKQKIPSSFTAAESSLPTVAVPAHGSLEFVLSSIAINETVGTVELTITEGSTGEPTEVISISKFPTEWGVVTFNANTANTSSGTDITLNWNGPANATYSIQYLDPSTQQTITIPTEGQPPLANSGTYPGQGDPPLSISATTVFTLLVTAVISGTEYETQAQQTVVVADIPTITSFTGTIQGELNDRQLLLTWETKNTSYVEGSWANGQELVANPTDPITIPLPFTADYSIIAVSNKGLKSKATTFTLNWKVLSEISTSGVGVSISPDGKYAFMVSAPSNVTLLAMELETFTVTESIPIPFIFGGITITPDSNYSFVLGEQEAGVVDINNLTAPAKTFYVAPGSLNGIGISPDSKHAYISNTFGVNAPLTIIDVNTLAQTTVSWNYNMSNCSYLVTPTSTYAYISTPINGIVVIDINTNTVASTIDLGLYLYELAITPNKKYAFVACYNSDNDMLAVIDIATNTVLKNDVVVQDLGSMGIALSLDSQYVFCLDTGKSIIKVIAVDTLTVIKEIPFANPFGIVNSSPPIICSPDGNWVFVMNRNAKTVSVIAISTLAIVQTIAYQLDFYLLTITPDSQYLFLSKSFSYSSDNKVAVIGLSLPSA